MSAVILRLRIAPDRERKYIRTGQDREVNRLSLRQLAGNFGELFAPAEHQSGEPGCRSDPTSIHRATAMPVDSVNFKPFSRRISADVSGSGFTVIPPLVCRPERYVGGDTRQ